MGLTGAQGAALRAFAGIMASSMTGLGIAPSGVAAAIEREVGKAGRDRVLTVVHDHVEVVPRARLSEVLSGAKLAEAAKMLRALQGNRFLVVVDFGGGAKLVESDALRVRTLAAYLTEAERRSQ